jgi:uncharacterized membrane protein HdeD (DUF308 family)
MSSHVAMAAGSLARAVSKNWWLFLLRGIAVVAFGVLALFAPVVTLVVLILLFGVVMFVMPGAGTLALIWVIAMYAIPCGILIIAFAFSVRNYRPKTA